jgi:hypothetical protein
MFLAKAPQALLSARTTIILEYKALPTDRRRSFYLALLIGLPSFFFGMTVFLSLVVASVLQ